MVLKRALFILVVVIPPTLGLTAATSLGWLQYEPSLGGVLSACGAYVGWAALVGAAAATGLVRKRHSRKAPAGASGAPAPRAGGGPYLPPPPPEGFVGRDEEIRRLEWALKPGRLPVITGVVGEEGVGKTELARVVAHRVAGAYRDGVLWADCSQQELANVADLWAAAYGVQLAGTQFDGKAAAWRSLIKDKEALLVLDNVQPGQEIGALFPPPSRSMVLITTPDAHHAALRAVDPVQVDQFSDDEAMELARWVLGEKVLGAQRGDAERFFESVGTLPLAVSIGLHIARDRGWSLAELGQEVERARAIRALGESGARESVGVLVQTAWDSLPSDLQRAFAVLAVFNRGPSFDTAAVAAVLDCDEPEARGLLDRLADGSLLTGVGENRWALHPLLREAVSERLPAQDVAWCRMAAHYMQVVGAADALYLRGGEELVQGLSLFDLEWPHICAGQAWAAAHAEDDDEAAKLCSGYPGAAVYCLTLRLHRREFADWLEAAVRASHHLGDRQAEANHLGNLGLAHAELGEMSEAIATYERALELAREIGDRRGEGNRLGKLGLAYAELGRMRDAIAYYERALEIAREIGDRWWEGNRLHNLGTAYYRLGEVREAIGYYEQGLEIAREIDDRRMEANRLGNLGSAYAALGAVREAIEYYEQALEITREIGDQRGESNRLGHLGSAYAQLGRAREAIPYYEQGLVIARQMGDRRMEGAHLGHLGRAYAQLAAVREAIEYYQQALEIAREIGDRRMEAGQLDNLGSAYAELDAVGEAIATHEEGLEIAREIGDRRMEADRLDKLGSTYAQEGELREAIGCYEEGLEIARDLDDRQMAADRLDRLGNAHHRLGDVRKAIDCYEEGLDIARELGDRQLEGARLSTLGLAYVALGEVRQAIGCHEQALELARELGDRRAEGNRLGNLGLAYASLGELREAIGYYGETMEIGRKIGDQRMEGNALGQLGLAYAALGRMRQAIACYRQGLELAREIGDQRGEGIRLANMGQAYRRLGDKDRAQELWEQALAVYEAIGDPNAERVRAWLEELGAPVISP